MSQAASTAQRSVSIVTQTCVRPERADDFARWQSETSSVIRSFPGFIEQRLLPPAPPGLFFLRHGNQNAFEDGYSLC